MTVRSRLDLWIRPASGPEATRSKSRRPAETVPRSSGMVSCRTGMLLRAPPPSQSQHGGGMTQSPRSSRERKIRRSTWELAPRLSARMRREVLTGATRERHVRRRRVKDLTISFPTLPTVLTACLVVARGERERFDEDAASHPRRVELTRPKHRRDAKDARLESTSNRPTLIDERSAAAPGWERRPTRRG